MRVVCIVAFFFGVCIPALAQRYYEGLTTDKCATIAFSDLRNEDGEYLHVSLASNVTRLSAALTALVNVERNSAIQMIGRTGTRYVSVVSTDSVQYEFIGTGTGYDGLMAIRIVHRNPTTQQQGLIHAVTLADLLMKVKLPLETTKDPLVFVSQKLTCRGSDYILVVRGIPSEPGCKGPQCPINLDVILSLDTSGDPLDGLASE